jgi:hypothetical protein
MTTHAQPMTVTLRTGELQVLSSFDASNPVIPIGTVANTIHMEKRKDRSSNRPRPIAASEFTANARTSLQK